MKKDFFDSIGQKAKYSDRAYVFRSSPISDRLADVPGRPLRADTVEKVEVWMTTIFRLT